MIHRTSITSAFIFLFLWSFGICFSQVDSTSEGFLQLNRTSVFDGSLWVGGGFNPNIVDKISIHGGGRFKFVGLQISQLGFGDEIPRFTALRAPDSTVFDTVLRRSSGQCVDLSLFVDIGSKFSLFASLGLYNRDVYLLRIDKNDRTPYLLMSQVASGTSYGLGLHYAVTTSLLVGLSANTFRGYEVSVGYRFSHLAPPVEVAPADIN